MKLITYVYLLQLLIQATFASSGNGITSSGLEKYSPYGYFAWFLGNTKVPVCLEVDKNFPIEKNVLKKLIVGHVDRWQKKYEEVTVFESIPKKARINFNFEFQEECSNETRLQFIFGIENEFIQNLKSVHKSPRGFATLLEFDIEKYLGKGIIWIEGPKNNGELFSPITADATLLHELGHVFGVPHIEGTIMTSNDLNLGQEASFHSPGIINIYQPHTYDDLKKFYSNLEEKYGKEKFEEFIFREMNRLENDEKIRNRIIRIDQESILGFNPKQNTRLNGRIPTLAIHRELKMTNKEQTQEILDFLMINKEKTKRDQKAELYVVTNIDMPKEGEPSKEAKTWITYNLSIDGVKGSYVFKPSVLNVISFYQEKLFTSLVLDTSKKAQSLPEFLRIRDYSVPNNTSEIYGEICNKENKCFKAYFYINKNKQCSIDILTDGTPVTIFRSVTVENFFSNQQNFRFRFDSFSKGEKDSNDEEDESESWEEDLE